MTIELYLTFIAASAILVAIPGPNVTIIIANSASHGTRAGLLTVAGTETGSAILLGAMMLGLAPIMELASNWFDWLRLAGAAYLVWLGLSRILGAGGGTGEGETAPRPARNPYWQGLAVILANPKVLLFFAAFLPQFIDPAGNVTLQLLLLAVTFLAVATLIDGAYALLAGRASHWLTFRHRQVVDRASGALLIGGGIWLALARR